MIDLWDLAQTANFTEKELESFRVRELGCKAVSPSAVASISCRSPMASGSLFFSIILECLCVFVLTLFLPAPGLCNQVVAGGHTSHVSSLSACCVVTGCRGEGGVCLALCCEVWRGMMTKV